MDGKDFIEVISRKKIKRNNLKTAARKGDRSNDDSPKVKCSICAKMFNSNQLLKKHMTTTHKDHETKKTSKEVKCEKCDIFFNTVLLMKNHITTYHDNKPQIKCIFCDFKTEEKTLFIVHTESHSNEQRRRQRPGNESICRWFAQGGCNFGEHCWNKHDQERPQPPQCRFKSNCNMWPFCGFGHFEVSI